MVLKHLCSDDVSEPIQIHLVLREGLVALRHSVQEGFLILSVLEGLLVAKHVNLSEVLRVFFKHLFLGTRESLS